jgi:hypothetical protein
VIDMGAKGLIAAVGFAAGYLVGTRRGRKDYEQMKRQAANFVTDPRVQKGLSDAQTFVTEKVPVVGETVASAIGAVRDAAEKASDKGTRTQASGAGATGAGSTGTGTGAGSTGTTGSGSSRSGTSRSGTSGSGTSGSGTTGTGTTGTGTTGTGTTGTGTGTSGAGTSGSGV